MCYLWSLSVLGHTRLSSLGTGARADNRQVWSSALTLLHSAALTVSFFHISFQGEEAKIVILSTVRNTGRPASIGDCREPTIGFLKVIQGQPIRRDTIAESASPAES
jgi:hypothetical protein